MTKLLLLLIVLVGAVAADLWRHGPLDQWLAQQADLAQHVVARVHDQPVTDEELQHATMEVLFRRGEDLQKLDPAAQEKARQEVLAQLIEGLRVRAARLAEEPQALAPGAVDEELRLFIKQFPLDTDYPARMPLQQVTEKELRDRMEAALADQAWIESQIAPQLEAITEAHARAWFEKHHDELMVPESFHAVHLFLEGHEPKKPDREPEIRKLHQQLTSGQATLESLIASVSEDERTKTHGGDLGWFTRERMPADFMKAVTALKAGETSVPVHTWLGWHIIKLLETKPARVPDFEEVKDEVLATLRNQRRPTAVKELLAHLEP